MTDAGPSITPAATAIVVLSWNGRTDTLRCLDSLVEHGAGARLLLVDNGSVDGTVEAVRAAHPGVEVLENGDNLGFAEGNNRGIDAALGAGATVVGILNNDTVVEPGFLTPLLDAVAVDPGRVYASPLIRYLDHPDDVWFEGASVAAGTGIWVHDGPGPAAGPDRTRSPMITGCALFAHRSVWERVGPLDPDYFLIFEDADWSARANALGCHGVVVRDSVIHHAVSATIRSNAPSAADYYYVRNGIRFLRSHRARPWRPVLGFVAEQARASTRAFRTRPSTTAVATPVLAARGALDGLRGRGGPLVLGPVSRWASGRRSQPGGSGTG